MTSKTLNKALSVLNAFTIEKPTWGLRELARHLEISHTIIYRLLVTFEQNGYLIYDEATKKYQLGIKFIELSQVVEENLNISNVLEPIMKKISEETGESVVLTILDKEEGVYTKIIESNQNVRFSETVGRRSPLYIGASHKIILVYLPVPIQMKIFKQWKTTKEKQNDIIEKFIDSIDKIKSQGWLFTANETFDEVSAVAIPLFDMKKNVIGSLSVAGPSYRLTKIKSEKIVEIPKKYQQEINLILDKIYLPSKRNE